MPNGLLTTATACTSSPASSRPGRAAQAAFGDAPVPDALDIAILDRALPADEVSALRAGRTVLVAQLKGRRAAVDH
jgi:hypothetical protein